MPVARARVPVAAAVVAASLLLLTLIPSAADAGTYDVDACDGAPGGANNSWVLDTGGNGMEASSLCPTNGSDHFGITLRNFVFNWWVGSGSHAAATFTAPEGNTVDALRVSRRIWRSDGDWRVAAYNQRGNFLEGCEVYSGAKCYDAIGSEGTASFVDIENTPRVQYVVRCEKAGGCWAGTDPAAPYGRAAQINLRGATVRIDDPRPPSLTVDAGGSPLWASEWQRGLRSVRYSTADSAGIKRTELLVDDAVEKSTDRDCDYTYTAPCLDVSGDGYTLDTRTLPDGEHTVALRSFDAAKNPTLESTTVKVDNTAPGRVTPEVEGTSDWRRTNGFDVRWTNPSGQSAPIARARYELCRAGTTDCTSGARDGRDIQALSNLAVPGPGDWTLRVYLEDAAGNASADNASDPVHLKFDDTVPVAAAPERANGWLNAEDVLAYDQRIQLPLGGAKPPSGVAGYSVAMDDAEPDDTIDVPGDPATYRIPRGMLTEGRHVFKARAVTNAGVASRDVGTTELNVDLSAPAASIDGRPEGAWSRTPVLLRLRGSDQPALSGMQGVPEPKPADAGGFLEYALDDGARSLVRGGEGTVRLTDDGRHVVRLVAHDVAGNASPEEAVEVGIDQTPPETVAFEAQDPRRPREVRVVASDRTSGVTGGTLQIRRAGGGDWQVLDARLEGDRFVATLDDEQLDPTATYELRAIVRDAAGNETVGDRRVDGSPATVAGSLRAGTRLSATGVVRAMNRTCTSKRARRKRPARRGKTRGRRVCTLTPGPEQPTTQLAVPFGKAAAVQGRLVDQSGQPLGGAELWVDARLRAAGFDFQPEGSVRTDAGGGFSYTAPAGASRTLRFRYDGSDVARPALTDVEVSVPSGLSLRVDKRRVRNGKSVGFGGNVLGGPFPVSGLKIDLQAYYRGAWRTFATPRTNATGGWSYRYRFQATRGTVVYRFRARLKPEAAYPYDLGDSPAVKVTVRG